MNRFSLIEQLEGRQLFAGSGLAAGGPGGGQPQDGPPQIRLPRFPNADTGASTAVVASYTGTITQEDDTEKRFGLTIVSDDGTNIVARIPGREGQVELKGTKSGNVYSLSASQDGRSVSVSATIDDSGNVTGTVTHSFTNAEGETETHSGTISLKKATAPTKPTTPPGDDNGGGTGTGGDDNGGEETPAAPIAVYAGDVTLENGDKRRFALFIISDTDGAIVARLPGRNHGDELTGTKSGNTYTLSSSEEGRSITVTVTVDSAGVATGSITHTHTKQDGTTETDTGTLALKSVDPTSLPTPTKPDGSVGGSNDNGGEKPVRPYHPPRETLEDLVVYTGSITTGEKISDVFVQTFTNKEGKTMLVIASKKRFGIRPILIEATLTDTAITASKSVDDRSIDISLALASDGSLTGDITLKRGDTTTVFTIDADKKVADTSAST